VLRYITPSLIAEDNTLDRVVHAQELTAVFQKFDYHRVGHLEEEDLLKGLQESGYKVSCTPAPYAPIAHHTDVAAVGFHTRLRWCRDLGAGNGIRRIWSRLRYSCERDGGTLPFSDHQALCVFIRLLFCCAWMSRRLRSRRFGR
jgi:hypothetical protein